MTPSGNPAPPTESFNGNNQITGLSYDQAGNRLSVNGNTLAFIYRDDSEGDTAQARQRGAGDWRTKRNNSRLLERTIWHKKGCQTCACGEGHPALVLSINYPGGRTKQISIRPEQREQVERWLRNYHNVKDKLEAICELNQTLLRPEKA